MNKRLTNEEFLKRLQKVHPGYTALSKYQKASVKVTIKCDKGHVFNILPSSLISQGVGCKKCSYIQKSKAKTWSNEKFLSKYPYCQVDQKSSGSDAFYFTLQKKALPDPKHDPSYRLKAYQNMVRMTNSCGQGHVPLVMGVRSASFTCQDRLLIIKITERNKQQTDLVCKLPPPPPKPKK